MIAPLCVLGSVNLDLVASAARLPAPGETVLATGYAEHPGGKGLNQAVAARRAGAATTLCACVGDDDAGRRLRAVAREAGLDGEHLHTVRGPATGRALIAVSTRAAQNQIVVVPGANLELTGAQAVAAVAGASVVLAQLEVPPASVAAAFAAAREHGARTILNPSPAEGVDDTLLALCNVVVANEHEAELLGGVGRILAAGAASVIVTLGAEGSRRTDAGDATHAVASFPVHALDSTAAGDAYCGAFAAALAAGRDADLAMLEASAAGALATTVAGAVPSLPERAAIEKLLATPHRSQRSAP